MTPLAMADQHETDRTQVTSIPVALDTAPQTPPRTRFSGLRRKVRSLWPSMVMAVVAAPSATVRRAATTAVRRRSRPSGGPPAGRVGRGIRARDRAGRGPAGAGGRSTGSSARRRGRAAAAGERPRAGIGCFCDTPMIARAAKGDLSGTSLRPRGRLRVGPGCCRIHPGRVPSGWLHGHRPDRAPAHDDRRHARRPSGTPDTLAPRDPRRRQPRARRRAAPAPRGHGRMLAGVAVGPGRLLRRRPDDGPDRLRRPGLPRRAGRAAVPRGLAARSPTRRATSRSPRSSSPANAARRAAYDRQTDTDTDT